jgi:mannose-6-phosphate isomerase-like protein (cupin superfamily)
MVGGLYFSAMIFRIAIVTVCLFTGLQTNAQIVQLHDYHPAEEYENVHVEKISSDSLASVFLIHIRETVPLHRHNWHTEIVYVLSGSGIMQLGVEMHDLESGQVITIPNGTAHSVEVTSEEPLVVLSVQSPQFLGKDREVLGQ